MKQDPTIDLILPLKLFLNWFLVLLFAAHLFCCFNGWYIKSWFQNKTIEQWGRRV